MERGEVFVVVVVVVGYVTSRRRRVEANDLSDEVKNEEMAS